MEGGVVWWFCANFGCQTSDGPTIQGSTSMLKGVCDGGL